MKELILASGNAHKVGEIQEILGNEYKVKGLKDLDRKIEIIEDGKTYEENALIKARTLASYYDAYVIGIGKEGALVVEKIDGTLEKVISGECIIKN